jgi:hypothetical protein
VVCERIHGKILEPENTYPARFAKDFRWAIQPYPVDAANRARHTNTRRIRFRWKTDGPHEVEIIAYH